MYCSKCGNELSDERFCPNCGEKISQDKGNDQELCESRPANTTTKTLTTIFDGVKENFKSLRVNRNLYFLLITLLFLELYFAMQPVVVIGSPLADITKSFTFFDVQSDNSLKLIIVVIHLLSIVSLIFPAATGRSIKSKYYLPTLVTSFVVSVMYIRLTLVMDSLITETQWGEILQYVADASLTTSSTCLIAVSTVTFLIATGMALGTDGNKTQ